MRETEIIGQHRWKFVAQVKIFLNKPCLGASSCCFCWTWEGWTKTNTKWCFDDWCMAGHVGWLVSPLGLFSQLHKSNEGAKKWSRVQPHAKTCISMHVGGGGGWMSNCGTSSLAGQTAAVIMRNFMFVHLNSLCHPLELAFRGLGWIVVFLITVCNKWSASTFGHVGSYVCA